MSGAFTKGVMTKKAINSNKNLKPFPNFSFSTLIRYFTLVLCTINAPSE